MLTDFVGRPAGRSARVRVDRATRCSIACDGGGGGLSRWHTSSALVFARSEETSSTDDDKSIGVAEMATRQGKTGKRFAWRKMCEMRSAQRTWSSQVHHAILQGASWRSRQSVRSGLDAFQTPLRRLNRSNSNIVIVVKLVTLTNEPPLSRL